MSTTIQDRTQDPWPIAGFPRPPEERLLRIERPPQDWSDVIRTLRADLGLTQLALARRLGISKNEVWYWEAGHANPTIRSVQAVLRLRDSVGGGGA